MKDGQPRSPWVAVGVILIGSYAAILNVTVIGVALPDIADSLSTPSGTSATSVDWVVSAFLVGVVLVLPVSGWLADWLGRRRLYIVSLATFGAGAGLCVLAPTLELLVAGRFVQGLGGGMLMPVGMAMVYELFPPSRRGTAMGIWGVGMMAAPAAGPPLGGWLVTVGSWRWVFGLFAAVAVVAMVLAARWLPDAGHRDSRRLDVVGWALMSVGVVLLVLGSRELPQLGLASPVTIGAVVVVLVVTVVMIRRSLRLTSPIVDLDMFAVRTFRMSMVIVTVLSVAQFAQLTFLPIELQVVRGLDTQRVGLLLAPAAVGVAAMMPISGWLADRIGAKLPVTVGLAVMAVSMWRLAHLRPDGSDAEIVRILVVQGIGMGLVMMPTTVAAMNSLPARFVAQASAVNNLARQLGGAIGIAALSALLVADLGAVSPIDADVVKAQAAYNRVFLVAFWATVMSCAIAVVFLPGRRRALADQEARAQELPDADGVLASSGR